MRHSTPFVVIAVGLVIIGFAVCVSNSEAQTRPNTRGGGGISLQPSTPGTAQSGNANLTGTVIAGNVQATATSGSGNVFGFLGPSTSNATTHFFNPAGSTTQPIFEFDSTASGAGTGQYMSFRLAGSQFGWINRNGQFNVNSGPSGGIISTSASLYIQSNSASPGVYDTNSNTVANGSDIFRFNNAGVTKASVRGDGTLITATVIPQASGGTGVGALTCLAGERLTSNGTAYSCSAVANGAIVASANISSTGTINKQSPASVISSVTKGATGIYTVNLTGMTASGILTCTPATGASPGYMCTATPAANAINVTIINGANGGVDQQFMLIVASL